MFLITTPSHSSMHAYFISFQNQFKIMLVISPRFLALLSIKCQLSQVGCSILRELLLQEATQEVLGLDVVNQIIFISKNGEEKYLKITFFFIFQKKFFKLQKFVKKIYPPRSQFLQVLITSWVPPKVLKTFRHVRNSKLDIHCVVSR